MHSLENKTPRDDRFLNPSFSSTLLDKIYRSIDEGERKSGEMRFYRETITLKKQSRSNGKPDINMVEDKKAGTEPCFFPTHHRDGDHDQDVQCFSSTSISSDSSSGFSSSDTESMYGARSRASRASCFAPAWPKPVRTSASFRSEKNEKQAARAFDGFCHNSKTEDIAVQDEKALFKSKSRALKIYNNLKKVKQPISPGGRLTSFLNSLFATGNARKTRGSTCYEDANSERKAKSVQASTCSSASSFSRSCLSKTTSCERDKLSSAAKRTVRFYPVSVVVDEESRPCGQKCLYEEDKNMVMPVSVPSAWKIGKSLNNKKDGELKLPVVEKSRVVEEAAREFLEEYRHNQKKNSLVSKKDFPIRTNGNNDEEDDDDDDDAASYASSDLFELDHLAVLGNARYCEELPVYETTRVSTNRAIANGLMV